MVAIKYFCLFLFLYGIAVMPLYINISKETVRSAFIDKTGKSFEKDFKIKHFHAGIGNINSRRDD